MGGGDLVRFRHLFLSFRLVKGDVEKLLVCVPGGRFPEGVARAKRTAKGSLCRISVYSAEIKAPVQGLELTLILSESPPSTPANKCLFLELES
ncbi:hypothetical protein CSV77_13240 [Sporosarcina sp. P16b]|nr:hypothetical protein CSV77_13240 [Sporosarcina sp. P16b]